MNYLKYIVIVSICAMSVAWSGCVVVKAQQEKETTSTGKKPEQRVTALSPKPTVPMSEEVVRSEIGDMVSLLPAKWFLLNTKATAPVSVFAVAVNPEYTVGLVYSSLRKEDGWDSTYIKFGIVGITKISLNKRERKSPATKSVGQMEEVSVGTKRFGIYKYTTDNGSTVNRVAVFRSSLGNFYECTMTEFSFTGRKLPSREETEQIYTSVLALIDY